MGVSALEPHHASLEGLRNAAGAAAGVTSGTRFAESRDGAGFPSGASLRSTEDGSMEAEERHPGGEMEPAEAAAGGVCEEDLGSAYRKAEDGQLHAQADAPGQEDEDPHTNPDETGLPPETPVDLDRAAKLTTDVSEGSGDGCRGKEDAELVVAIASVEQLENDKKEEEEEDERKKKAIFRKLKEETTKLQQRMGVKEPSQSLPGPRRSGDGRRSLSTTPLPVGAPSLDTALKSRGPDSASSKSTTPTPPPGTGVFPKSSSTDAGRSFFPASFSISGEKGQAVTREEKQRRADIEAKAQALTRGFRNQTQAPAVSLAMTPRGSAGKGKANVWARSESVATPKSGAAPRARIEEEPTFKAAPKPQAEGARRKFASVDLGGRKEVDSGDFPDPRAKAKAKTPKATGEADRKGFQGEKLSRRGGNGSAAEKQGSEHGKKSTEEGIRSKQAEGPREGDMGTHDDEDEASKVEGRPGFPKSNTDATAEDHKFSSTTEVSASSSTNFKQQGAGGNCKVQRVLEEDDADKIPGSGTETNIANPQSPSGEKMLYRNETQPVGGKVPRLQSAGKSKSKATGNGKKKSLSDMRGKGGSMQAPSRSGGLGSLFRNLFHRS